MTEVTVVIGSGSIGEALARRAAAIGAVSRLVHAAGVSPSQAPPKTMPQSQPTAPRITRRKSSHGEAP